MDRLEEIMFYYFKSKDGKSVMRLSTKPPFLEAQLKSAAFGDMIQVEHEEFVKLRRQIRKYGSFSVEVPGMPEVTITPGPTQYHSA